jgi:hypothetical protein
MSFIPAFKKDNYIHPFFLKKTSTTWNLPTSLSLKNKGCVTLWPCHLCLKVSYGKRRIMETQIFHHAKKI